MNPTTTNQSSWTFGIPEPPKHSQMVKDIIAMEKELADLRSEIGQIIATLEVNYGMDGRRQDGIAVDSKDKRPLMFMIAVLTEYSQLLTVARDTGKNPTDAT